MKNFKIDTTYLEAYKQEIQNKLVQDLQSRREKENFKIVLQETEINQKMENLFKNISSLPAVCYSTIYEYLINDKEPTNLENYSNFVVKANGDLYNSKIETLINGFKSKTFKFKAPMKEFNNYFEKLPSEKKRFEEYQINNIKKTLQQENPQLFNNSEKINAEINKRLQSDNKALKQMAEQEKDSIIYQARLFVQRAYKERSEKARIAYDNFKKAMEQLKNFKKVEHDRIAKIHSLESSENKSLNNAIDALCNIEYDMLEYERLEEVGLLNENEKKKYEELQNKKSEQEEKIFDIRSNLLDKNDERLKNGEIDEVYYQVRKDQIEDAYFDNSTIVPALTPEMVKEKVVEDAKVKSSDTFNIGRERASKYENKIRDFITSYEHHFNSKKHEHLSEKDIENLIEKNTQNVINKIGTMGFEALVSIDLLLDNKSPNVNKTFEEIIENGKRAPIQYMIDGMFDGSIKLTSKEDDFVRAFIKDSSLKEQYRDWMIANAYYKLTKQNIIGNKLDERKLKEVKAIDKKMNKLDDKIRKIVKADIEKENKQIKQERLQQRTRLEGGFIYREQQLKNIKDPKELKQAKEQLNKEKKAAKKAMDLVEKKIQCQEKMKVYQTFNDKGLLGAKQYKEYEKLSKELKKHEEKINKEMFKQPANFKEVREQFDTFKIEEPLFIDGEVGYNKQVEFQEVSFDFLDKENTEKNAKTHDQIQAEIKAINDKIAAERREAARKEAEKEDKVKVEIEIDDKVEEVEDLLKDDNQLEKEKDELNKD